MFFSHQNPFWYRTQASASTWIILVFVIIESINNCTKLSFRQNVCNNNSVHVVKIMKFCSIIMASSSCVKPTKKIGRYPRYHYVVHITFSKMSFSTNSHAISFLSVGRRSFCISPLHCYCRYWPDSEKGPFWRRLTLQTAPEMLSKMTQNPGTMELA